MANSKYVKLVFFTLLFTLIISVLYDLEVEARRGGSFRSGFRSSRTSRSSYRSTRVRSRNRYASRVRSSMRSRFFNWKTAAVAGGVYGWYHYSRTPRYSRYPDRRPMICVNLYDYKSDNGTLQEMFICPKYNQGEDYKYCCGPEDRQVCCRYWDKGGNIAGVVIGVLVLIGIIALVIFCICKRKSKTPGFIHSFKKKDSTAKYAMTSNQPTAAAPGYPTYPNMAPSYPQKDAVPPATMPYPPATGPGYPVGPSGGPGYPPQGGQPAYPPQDSYPPMPQADGGLPYPPAAPPMENNMAPYPTQPYAPPFVPPPQENTAGYPNVAPPPYVPN